MEQKITFPPMRKRGTHQSEKFKEWKKQLKGAKSKSHGTTEGSTKPQRAAHLNSRAAGGSSKREDSSEEGGRKPAADTTAHHKYGTRQTCRLSGSGPHVGSQPAVVADVAKGNATSGEARVGGTKRKEPEGKIEQIGVQNLLKKVRGAVDWSDWPFSPSRGRKRGKLPGRRGNLRGNRISKKLPTIQEEEEPAQRVIRPTRAVDKQSKVEQVQPKRGEGGQREEAAMVIPLLKVALEKKDMLNDWQEMTGKKYMGRGKKGRAQKEFSLAWRLELPSWEKY